MSTDPQIQGRSLLDGYLSRLQLAADLGVDERTLDRWHRECIGPPRTLLGRHIYYRKETVAAWLRSRERSYVKMGARA